MSIEGAGGLCGVPGTRFSELGVRGHVNPRGCQRATDVGYQGPDSATLRTQYKSVEGHMFTL